ncbi:MAG: hypothetical protein GX493_03005 [Firmicutes bacterium]|nr:hypothetical protein [Bacillota bacterium]
MRVEVKLPFLSEEIEYCRVLRWLVSPGETVEIDQDLAELAMGEEIFLFPSPVDGRIVEILAPEGAMVVTDEPLLVIEEQPDGEER